MTDFSTPTHAFEPALVERGTGRPVLVLHGGGGPRTVAGIVESLAAGAHVLAPTHPGFAGTPRPPECASVAELAALYAGLLERRGLWNVLVVGSSMGGWIAAELALRAPGRLRGLVLVNAVGIVVEGEPVADVFSLTPRGLAELSWHDPDRFAIDPATLTPEMREAMAANFRALAVYGGKDMADASLKARLAGVKTPTLVAWGESDRVATTAYGRAFAAAIPGARFEPIAQCGHLPQMEQPARLLELVRAFDAA